MQRENPKSPSKIEKTHFTGQAKHETNSNDQNKNDFKRNQVLNIGYLGFEIVSNLKSLYFSMFLIPS